MLVNAPVQDIATAVTEAVSQSEHREREAYYLAKLEHDANYADDSINLLNEVDKILSASLYDKDETSVYAFNFMVNSLDVLPRKTTVEQRHIQHTERRLLEISEQVQNGGPGTHSDFLIGAVNRFYGAKPAKL